MMCGLRRCLVFFLAARCRCNRCVEHYHRTVWSIICAVQRGTGFSLLSVGYYAARLRSHLTHAEGFHGFRGTTVHLGPRRHNTDTYTQRLH